MQPVPIHFAAFAVATIAKFAIGWLWYSPLMFMRQWKTLSGVTEETMKTGMGTAIAIWFGGSLVMAFVLAHAVFYAGAHGPAQGAAVGFFNWLGFVLVTMLDDYAAEKTPFKLVAIKSGNQLVGLIVMGMILATW